MRELHTCKVQPCAARPCMITSAHAALMLSCALQDTPSARRCWQARSARQAALGACVMHCAVFDVLDADAASLLCLHWFRLSLAVVLSGIVPMSRLGTEGAKQQLTQPSAQPFM